MKLLWTPEGRTALERLLAAPVLLAFDFDGTLAPIVPRPEDARVPTAIAHRMALLAERHPVAVITGRSVDDVRERLDFTPRHIVGNHGAESRDAAQAEDWAKALAPLRAHLARHAEALRKAGVQVEDKRFSLALHYRLAPDRQHAMTVIEQVLANSDAARLRRFGGKCIENVMARTAPDKGDALAHLTTELGVPHALYVGDDINDETVFRRAEPDWLTVRIGHKAPHSAARFFLPGPSGLAQLLETLLRTPY